MAFEKETTEDVIAYILQKDFNFSDKDVAEIIFIADIDHYILGRTITRTFIKGRKYLVTDNAVKSFFPDRKRVLEKREFKYLSESDRKALDFAIIRQYLDDSNYLESFEMKINKKE